MGLGWSVTRVKAAVQASLHSYMILQLPCDDFGIGHFTSLLRLFQCISVSDSIWIDIWI